MVNQSQIEIEYNSDTSREILTLENDHFKLQYEGEKKYYLQLAVDETDEFNAKEIPVTDGDVITLSVKQALKWCEHTDNADQFPEEIL